MPNRMPWPPRCVLGARRQLRQIFATLTIIIQYTNVTKLNLMFFLTLLLQPYLSENETSTVGKILLKTRGMYTQEFMYWICVAALLGFSLLFNLFFIAALTYLNRKLLEPCSNIH